MKTPMWWAVAIIVSIALIAILKSKERPYTPEPLPPSAAPTGDETAQFQAARARMEALLANARRVGFDPQVEARDTQDPVSKFGGAPWMHEGETWPRCKGCKNPLSFFVQLDVASLPEELGAGGSGLIQFFQCTDPELETDECMESWTGGPAAVNVRLVDTSTKGATLAIPDGHEAFPSRVITGWTSFDDYPGYEDMLDVKLTEDLDEDEFEKLDELSSNLDGPGLCRDHDKLGGWPYWVQGAEWKTCPTCQKQMQLILQLDSEDNVPHMFGDAGIGHILQCPDHPEQLSWGWACY